MMGPGEVFLGLFFFTAVGLIGYPLARAIGRRLEGKPQGEIPRPVLERLERMEQALDSIAIEVERISEGQRFTTKLLSERPRESLPAAGREDR